ncbi:MAG TPA: hypothetical protein VIR60_02475, partial [Gammaproteobacteria bacterium]
TRRSSAGNSRVRSCTPSSPASWCSSAKIERDDPGQDTQPITVLILVLLILLPIAAWFWARHYRPLFVWRLTGTAFGIIVVPFCLGLYLTFFLSPFGFVTGFVGLTAGMIHSAPGYGIATAVGLVESHEVVEGDGLLWLFGVNAIVWSAVYGISGWLLDLRRVRNTANASTP